MAGRHSSRADFDSPWKEALEGFFAPFLAFLYPEVHAGIDWQRGYESLDKELHQLVRAAGGKVLADKLFQVWRPNGDETWLLIHVEVQGEPEEDFPLRMFRYNARAFDRYNRTVVSLAVLTDERPDWRPRHFEYGGWGARTSIEFLVAKLLDWRGREAELEAAANPFARLMLAHLRALETRRDPEARGRYKIHLVKGLYRQGWSADEVRQLFRLIDWLLELPEELKQVFEEDLHRWEEEIRMPYVTSIERTGIEKGLQQGLELGRQEGRQEGREEGREEGLQEAIAAALEAKFRGPGKRLMSRVRKIRDLDELRQLLKAVLAAHALDEIRNLLTT